MSVDVVILRQFGVILILCCELDVGKVIVLEMVGVEVMQMFGQDKKQGIYFDVVLELLVQCQVNDVLVEVGLQLVGNFIDQGFMDEWICYVVLMLMGSSVCLVLVLLVIDIMVQVCDLLLNL